MYGNATNKTPPHIRITHPHVSSPGRSAPKIRTHYTTVYRRTAAKNLLAEQPVFKSVSLDRSYCIVVTESIRGTGRSTFLYCSKGSNIRLWKQWPECRRYAPSSRFLPNPKS